MERTSPCPFSLPLPLPPPSHSLFPSALQEMGLLWRAERFSPLLNPSLPAQMPWASAASPQGAPSPRHRASLGPFAASPLGTDRGTGLSIPAAVPSWESSTSHLFLLAVQPVSCHRAEHLGKVFVELLLLRSRQGASFPGADVNVDHFGPLLQSCTKRREKGAWSREGSGTPRQPAGSTVHSAREQI